MSGSPVQYLFLPLAAVHIFVGLISYGFVCLAVMTLRYFALESCLLIKILFVFCQAVILNEHISVNSPAWLSNKWFIDSRGPINVRNRLINRQKSIQAPSLITTTYHRPPSADQQIRGGMLNLSAAEGPCKKSLGHQ